MRHLVGVLIGFAGVVAGTLVMAIGSDRAFTGLARLRVEETYPAAPLVLLGGLLLGGVVAAGRWSPAAPLTAAVVLLAASAYSLAEPLGFARSAVGGTGLGTLFGMQLGFGLTGLFAVAAVAARRPRHRSGGPAQGYPGAPYTGRPPHPGP